MSSMSMRNSNRISEYDILLDKNKMNYCFSIFLKKAAQFI